MVGAGGRRCTKPGECQAAVICRLAYAALEWAESSEAALACPTKHLASVAQHSAAIDFGAIAATARAVAAAAMHTENSINGDQNATGSSNGDQHATGSSSGDQGRL